MKFTSVNFVCQKAKSYKERWISLRIPEETSEMSPKISFNAIKSNEIVKNWANILIYEFNIHVPAASGNKKRNVSKLSRFFKYFSKRIVLISNHYQF